MPTPRSSENEQEFISRCIPIVLDEGTAKDQEQAAAICYSIWREKTNMSETYQNTVEKYDDNVVWVLKCKKCIPKDKIK